MQAALHLGETLIKLAVKVLLLHIFAITHAWMLLAPAQAAEHYCEAVQLGRATIPDMISALVVHVTIVTALTADCVHVITITVFAEVSFM
jgi:hypothetical protein